MKLKNENLNEPQKPQLNIGAVISSYIKQFKIKKNGKTNRNRLIL